MTNSTEVAPTLQTITLDVEQQQQQEQQQNFETESYNGGKPPPTTPCTTAAAEEDDDECYCDEARIENHHHAGYNWWLTPKLRRKHRGIVIALITLLVVILVVMGGSGRKKGSSSAASGSSNSSDSANAWGAQCHQGKPIVFANTDVEQSTAVVQGDTRQGDSFSSAAVSPLCDDLPQSHNKGLLFQWVQPLNQPGRVTVGICPADGGFPSGSLRVTVLSGACQPATNGSLATSTQPSCVTSKVILPSLSTCQDDATTSSVSWYANGDGTTYFIHVQPVSSDAGGRVELRLKRSWTPLGSDNLQGSVMGGSFGYSVATSRNGFLVVASQPFSSNGQVRFFRRSSNAAGTYVEDDGLPLLAPVNQTAFGFNVDVSNDGTTIAVTSASAVNIYQVTSDLQDLNQEIALQTQLTHKISPSNQKPASVSVSGDGTTVAWNLDADGGTVQVYRRTSINPNAWMPLGGTLSAGTLMGATIASAYDKAVALSADGNKIAYATSTNSVQMYQWQHNAWTLRGTIDKAASSVAIADEGNCVVAGNLIDSAQSGVQTWCLDNANQWSRAGGDNTNNLGRSVSLSQDGQWMAIGDTLNGQARFYQLDMPTGTWELQGEIMAASSTTTQQVLLTDLTGWSTALSADGSTLVMGVPGSANDAGTVRVIKVFT